jgi:hypothetical protein
VQTKPTRQIVLAKISSEGLPSSVAHTDHAENNPGNRRYREAVGRHVRFRSLADILQCKSACPLCPPKRISTALVGNFR